MDVVVSELDDMVPSEREDVLAQVEGIERRSFPEYESLADILRHEVKGRARTLLVARPVTDPRAVAGYLLLERSAIVVHIMKLAVAEAMRRRGVGRSLLRAAAQRVKTPVRGRTSATSRPVGAMTLHVDPARTEAVALYTSMGFAEDSRRVDYYAAGRDALFMELDLTAE